MQENHASYPLTSSVRSPTRETHKLTTTTGDAESCDLMGNSDSKMQDLQQSISEIERKLQQHEEVSRERQRNL